jgi:hypothetical protein
MTPAGRVNYGNLSRQARQLIKSEGWLIPGVTIAGYVRYWSADGVWRGDACGCPDDRCIGFHHDEQAACGCVDVTLGEYARWAAGCPGCGERVTRYAADAVEVYNPDAFVFTWWHRAHVPAGVGPCSSCEHPPHLHGPALGCAGWRDGGRCGCPDYRDER